MSVSRAAFAPCKRALLACLLIVIGTFAAAQTTPVASTPAPNAKNGPTPERLDLLAHHLLAAAAKSNGLAADDLRPWHMKVSFEMLPSGSSTKPVSGTFEEWHADRYHWRRTYTSSQQEWTGSEWRVGKAHRFVTRHKHLDFEDDWLTSRIARPVVNPLYQIDDIRPDDTLLVKRETTGDLVLNCTSLAHPVEAYGRMPEWIVPTMCFDSDLHVRVMRSENILGQFFDLQPFQGRAIARDIQLIVNGRLYCEMKVTLLESIENVDQALVKPDADTIEQPFVIESGDPQPVATYQAGASIPIVSGFPPYRGTLAFPVIIHKDGTVKVEGSIAFGPMKYIWDAISNAVERWKYQPYVVDGQPVEVAFRIIYNFDGKPFVPVMQRQ
jgi:hypothetical protein